MTIRGISICLTLFLFGAQVVAQQASQSSGEPTIQQTNNYTVARNTFGQPDISGVWQTRFLTNLERTAGVESLVVDAQQAASIAAEILASIPHNEDPEIEWEGVSELALVRGEYRSSLIVDPADGLLPYREAALPQVEFSSTRYQTQFDHPEQRPLAERCLGSMGFPPIQSIPVLLPYQIVQTRDQILIFAEGPAGVRIVYLDSQRKQPVPASHEGYSTGHWDGDTLVVRTINFRPDMPERSGFGRPMLISPDTVIEERFTRLSATELNYFFTVTDAGLYTQPWSGEFSLYAQAGPIYEYACHEGNYSLQGILRGGQLYPEAN